MLSLQDRAGSQSQSDPESGVTSEIFCVLNTEYISASRASVPPSHRKYVSPTEHMRMLHHALPSLRWCECGVLLACLLILQLLCTIIICLSNDSQSLYGAMQ